MTSEQKKNGMMKMLNMSITNESKLSNVMKDYDNGIVTDVIDTRSTYEKMQDKQYMSKKLIDDVYNLFNQDPQTSEEFLTILKENGIGSEYFDIAYPQLITSFKGKLVSPHVVFKATEQLINNFTESGNAATGINSSKLNDIVAFLERMFDSKVITKKEGDDMVDKIKALQNVMKKNNLMFETNKEIQDFYDYFKKRGSTVANGAVGEIREATVDLFAFSTTNAMNKDNGMELLGTLTEIFERLNTNTFRLHEQEYKKYLTSKGKQNKAGIAVDNLKKAN